MTETLGLLRVLDGEGNQRRTTWAVLAALLGHGVLMGIALQQEPTYMPLVTVTEVEMLAPRDVPPPPPPPPPVEPIKAPAPAAAAPRAPRRAAPVHTPPPAPAMAAPLRTVAEETPSSDEPVRFVTDPNGSAFGYGTVARGGTAVAGQKAAAPSPQPGATGPRETGQPLLSRPPMLGEADPCRGFFPVRAQVDRGEVALKVKVEADGRVRTVSVARESPLGHGFGFAARDCLLSKRFTPALDRAGREVAVVSPVTVRFSR